MLAKRHLISSYRLIILLSVALLKVNAALGQTLSIGSDPQSLVIKANGFFSVSGLSLFPDEDFDLSGNIINRSDTLVNKVIQAFVPLSYHFSSPGALFSGLIQIDYDPASIPEGMNEANLKLHFFDGDTWQIDLTSEANTGTQQIASSRLTNVSLGELTLSDNPSVLPVTWLSFSVEMEAENVKASWSTASETNSQEFEVQSSVDAITWTTKGRVNAAGFSSTPKYYQFLDEPFSGARIIYYRILQRDFDGQFSYSPIRSIQLQEGASKLTFYPNPTIDWLQITLSNEQQVRIVHVNGAIVWEGKLSEGSNTVSLGHLIPGLYFLQCQNRAYAFKKL
jgi:hypothetical protein